MTKACDKDLSAISWESKIQDKPNICAAKPNCWGDQSSRILSARATTLPRSGFRWGQCTGTLRVLLQWWPCCWQLCPACVASTPAPASAEIMGNPLEKRGKGDLSLFEAFLLLHFWVTETGSVIFQFGHGGLHKGSELRDWAPYCEVLMEKTSWCKVEHELYGRAGG